MNELSRRDILKGLTAVGAGFAVYLYGLDKLLQSHKNDIPLSKETTDHGETIDMSHYIREEAGSQLNRIDYVKLHEDFPEIVVQISNEEFEGWCFMPPDEKILNLDFAKLKGREIVLEKTLVKRAAVRNIDPIAHATYDKVAIDEKEWYGYGEYSCGLVCIGNVSINGLSSTESDLITSRDSSRDFRGVKADRQMPKLLGTDLDCVIYGRSQNYKDGLARPSNAPKVNNVLSVSGVEIRNYNLKKRSSSDDNDCPSPAGITADNIHLVAQNVYCDGSLESSSQIPEELRDLANDPTSPDYNDALVMKAAWIHENIVPVHEQAAVGINAISTVDQPVFVDIRNSTIEALWEAVSLCGNVVGSTDSCIVRQNQSAIFGFARGDSIGATWGGRIKIRNCDVWGSKSPWATNSFRSQNFEDVTDGRDLEIEDSEIHSWIWFAVARANMEHVYRNTKYYVEDIQSEFIFQEELMDSQAAEKDKDKDLSFLMNEGLFTFDGMPYSGEKSTVSFDNMQIHFTEKSLQKPPGSLCNVVQFYLPFDASEPDNTRALESYKQNFRTRFSDVNIVFVDPDKQHQTRVTQADIFHAFDLMNADFQSFSYFLLRADLLYSPERKQVGVVLIGQNDEEKRFIPSKIVWLDKKAQSHPEKKQLSRRDLFSFFRKVAR